MDWRRNLIEHLEQQIASFGKGIEMMENGILRTGELDTSGRSDDTTAETLETYKRIVAELEEIYLQTKSDLSS